MREGAEHRGVALGAGAVVMLVCCGGHLLALGLIGGLAAGSVLGVAAGVLLAAALLAVPLIVRWRRNAAACDVPSSPPATRKAGPCER